VLPHLYPLEAAREIDQVPALAQHLVPPVAGQQDAGASLPRSPQESVLPVSQRIEQRNFDVPDLVPRVVHDAGHAAGHAID
jgi:hypothetical protein